MSTRCWSCWLSRAAWRSLMVAFREVGRAASRVGVQAHREFDVAVLLVEVRGDRVAARDVSSTSASAANPAGAPSASPTATARLSRTIGVSANRSSSSYHSTIWTQSVSSTRRASACNAAIAACVWYSPRWSRASAACAMPMPSPISPVSHWLRS